MKNLTLSSKSKEFGKNKGKKRKKSYYLVCRTPSFQLFFIKNFGINTDA